MKLEHLWIEYQRAYRVHEAIDSLPDKQQNKDAKLACILIACHMRGEDWCQDQPHPYRQLDELDFQIVEDEERRLKDQGVLK